MSKDKRVAVLDDTLPETEYPSCLTDNDLDVDGRANAEGIGMNDMPENNQQIVCSICGNVMKPFVPSAAVNHYFKCEKCGNIYHCDPVVEIL